MKLSHTTVWSNIAYLAATAVFLKIGLTATTLDPLLFLVYIGTIGASHAALQLIDAWKTKPASPPDT